MIIDSKLIWSAGMNSMRQARGKCSLIWVPGYSRIKGNEEVNLLARKIHIIYKKNFWFNKKLKGKHFSGITPEWISPRGSFWTLKLLHPKNIWISVRINSTDSEKGIVGRIWGELNYRTPASVYSVERRRGLLFTWSRSDTQALVIFISTSFLE